MDRPKNTKQEIDLISEPNNKSSGPKVYESPQLFDGNNEIRIKHAGELYRIRITRNGKLIMNK
jgi:hemin uptake protein HemP